MLATTDTKNPLADVQAMILSITPAMPNDDVLAIYTRVKFFKQQLAQMLDATETGMLEWIAANGDLHAGNGVRYYAGHPKTTKCTDVPATVDALLTAVQGDAAKFCEVMASNAIKHGAAKKVLAAEVYAALFKTEVRDKLEEGKAAPKELMVFDEKFAR